MDDDDFTELEMPTWDSILMGLFSIALSFASLAGLVFLIKWLWQIGP